MSTDEPTGVAGAPELRAGETPVRARTPGSVVFALLLFAFAIASPFLGELDARDARGDGGWATLGVMLGWLFAGAVAALAGIICTIVGARRMPMTGWTWLAIVLAFVAASGFLFLLTRMSF